MRNRTVIGIGGVARVGKNLFCDLATKILNERGFNVKTYSLAYYLKKDCEQFIQDKLGLSVWSEMTEEKTVFRPFLVWYADVLRTKTKGRVFVEKLMLDIEKDTTTDVVLISDLRYHKYDHDEVPWLKNEMNGKLIHLDKYHEDKTGIKHFVLPANDHEELNDPKLKISADFNVEWKHKPVLNYSTVLDDVELLHQVDIALYNVCPELIRPLKLV